MAAEPGIGALIGGRYRLEHLVGEGGMGAVWVAEDEKLSRWVAVKLMGERAAGSKSAAERFQREAMAIARLRSPHVVQVFDYGIDDARGFLVMELLHGDDLRAWLRRNRPAPLREVARIVVQVAKALAAMHRAGIVHRDLKPANVFVVREHEEETVKVFDFGLAKGGGDLALVGDRTADGVLLGTPRYMSPEQAHGARRVDHRSDLWALGVIAYLAVTGRLPFRGLGVGEVITKIATEPHAAPSSIVSGLPAGLDEFFERALAKDPDQRFDDAMAFARAFADVAGEGMTASELDLPGEGDTLLDPTETDTQLFEGEADVTTGERAPEPPLEVAPSPLPSDVGEDTVDDGATTLAWPEAREVERPPPAPEPARARRYWPIVAALVVVAAILAVAAPPGARRGAAASRLGPAVAAIVNGALASAPPLPSSFPEAPLPEPTASAELPTREPADVPSAAPATSGEPVSSSAPVDSAALPADRGLGTFGDRH